jgi:hypothetical protein
MEELIGWGAALEPRTAKRETPFIIAAQRRNFQVVRRGG